MNIDLIEVKLNKSELTKVIYRQTRKKVV